MKARAVSQWWAAKTDQTNQLDGRKVQLHLHWWKSLKQNHGTTLMLFKTRAQCRAWIEEEYGYIRKRPDLLAEPHGWRVPHPVKVTVEVTSNEKEKK
jgi:hypothetical protein